MKGSPLLRALVLGCVIFVLGWPLHLLTQRGQEAADKALAEPTASVVKSALPLVLTFSQPAQRVELRHLGAVVWVKDHPALHETLELSLPFPKEGLELGVNVGWTGESPAALRLQLTSPEGAELERTVWGTASVETVVPFP